MSRLKLKIYLSYLCLINCLNINGSFVQHKQSYSSYQLTKPMTILLSFTSNLLSDKLKISSILNQLSHLPQPIQIQSNTNHSQQTQLVISKLKLISIPANNNQYIFSVKIWNSNDSISHTLLLGYTFNVVIDGEGEFDASRFLENGNTVVVEVGELEGLLGLSMFQFAKRCKIQRLMRKTQNKCNQNDSRNKMKKMALLYANQMNQKQLRIFYNFMRFNAKQYLYFIRRFFTTWMIYHYQRGILQANELMIREQYLCQKYKTSLLRKCLQTWKSNNCNKN